MSAFNTKEFDEILEKCKDQSNQAKQDEVSNLFLSLVCMLTMTCDVDVLSR